CRAADRAGGGRGALPPEVAQPGSRRLDGTGAQAGALAMSAPHPVQEFFSIGEVCQLTDLKPHVLRYWESQFRFLNPAKNRSGNRVYQRREIELIMLVKHLLYTEKYTIEGARQKIEQYRRSGELKPEARRALATQTVKDLRVELKSILALLEGNASANAGARGPPCRGRHPRLSGRRHHRRSRCPNVPCRSGRNRVRCGRWIDRRDER